MTATSLCVGLDQTVRGYFAQALSMLDSSAPPLVPLSRALLKRGDDSTSNAIIAAFACDSTFAAFAKNEMDGIIARDDEDAEKLAAGIREAVARGVLDPNPPVEPVCKVNVAGKSADQVAGEIVAKLGAEASTGCVLVLQGLSGTGKGTTVSKLEMLLPKCVCWSNGNVFRSLTLLAVTHCEKEGVPFSAEAITPAVLAKLVKCLSFGKFGGKFDIRIKGMGLDLLVSEIANTTLKEPRVGKNIPTIAKMSQGEVIKFAAGAAEQMRSAGQPRLAPPGLERRRPPKPKRVSRRHNVLMEGRSQTLDYVRTPHRFELTLPDPSVIGQRRAAQRMMAAALQETPRGGRATGAPACL